LSKLIEAFEKFSSGEHDSKKLRGLIHSSSEGLYQLENYLPKNQNHLLIVDQFEEVFTLTPKNERQRIIKLLDQVLTKPSARLKILLAMRADFLEPCLQHATLTQIIQLQTIYVPPLEEYEWRKIIVEPADCVDYHIEAGLQEEILKDVEQETTCLPLLQFTLLKLWENRNSDKRLITHASYVEVGGLLGALNYYSDLFFESLSDVEQHLLKIIFLKLVRTGLVKNTRQRQLRKCLMELAGDNQTKRDYIIILIDKLLNEQLLIQEEECGEIWIDLVHEVLMDRWQLFVNWQEETRSQRNLIAPLEDALYNWQKNSINKNLANPKILKRILDSKESVEYLSFLDTSLKVFYQKSLEHHRLRQSSQLVTAQNQGDRKVLEQSFISDFVQTTPSSKNGVQEEDCEILETLEKNSILDLQKAKEIVREPQKNSAIIDNIVNVYGDHINTGNVININTGNVINAGNISNCQNDPVDRYAKEIPNSQRVQTDRDFQMSNREQESGKTKNILIDFIIVTALKKERLAVLKCLEIDEISDRVRKGSRTYWRKRLHLQNGKFYEIVIAQSQDTANVNAALLANDMFHHWKPVAVLMVGIAAASDPQQRLGDLVVGKEIYCYEAGKITAEVKLPEPKQIPADATLLNRTQALPDADFLILVDRPDGTKNFPKIEWGVIASGEKVIADASERDKIAAANREIMAIEMEAYGVIAAAWQSFEQVRCLVIRALCDYADDKKNDQWQAYAAAVAAGYTRHFLLDEPLIPRNSPEILE
jgi:nucleoside phosphorylase